jgi:hypothetical protein
VRRFTRADDAAPAAAAKTPLRTQTHEEMMTPMNRFAKRDIAFTVLLTGFGLLMMWDQLWDSGADIRANPTPDQQPAIEYSGPLPDELAIVLFPLVTLPLLWRRPAPFAALIASFTALMLNEVLIGTDFLRCGVVWPTSALLVFACATRLELRQALIALGLALLMCVVDFGTGFGPAETVFFSALTTVVWGIGRVVRSRRAMAAELEARTVELRDARDERARLEVASTRAALSGELEVLLQQRLGELARMAEAPGAATTATLVDIETESRRTLEQMREVVGALRDGAATAPDPTLTQIEALLVSAKGGDARIAIDGTPRMLPPGVELSAYRIVEHLLSALDDAPGVEVRVRFGDDGLGLTVAGPGRRGAAAAIERARERVRLHHGTLEAATRDGRTEVAAWLPLLAHA